MIELKVLGGLELSGDTVPGDGVRNLLAKTVMVTLDDQMAMAVLPSSMMVDLERLLEAAGVGRPAPCTEVPRRGPLTDLGRSRCPS